MKNLYEGILSDIETNINQSDDYILIYEFIKCLNDSDSEFKFTDEELNDILQFAVSNDVLSCKNNEITCNYDNLKKIKRTADIKQTLFDTIGILFTSNGINISATLLPKSLKKVVYKGIKEISINLVKTNDISCVDLEITDNDSVLMIYPAADVHDDIVKLGKINCSTLKVYENINSSSPDGISIKPGSNIDTLDLSKCKHKGFVIDGLKLNNVKLKDIIINKVVFSNTIKKAGIQGNLKLHIG